MKALITNIHHYIIMLIDRGDEPLYYYLRFRVAVMSIIFLFGYNYMTFREMQYWVQEANFWRNVNTKILERHNGYLRQIQECRDNNQMLTDIITSGYHAGIIRFYCDDFRKWQDRQLRNANTTEKSLTGKENN
jgi:hypothetical protein